MPTELPPSLSEHDAVAHIEGLLNLGDPAPRAPKARAVDDALYAPVADDNESDEGEQPESDTAPDESQASQDEEIEENEPADESAIEPPKSWNADEQAKFRELPPELQQVVARRESERDTAISQRMNQLADQRKAIEADVAKANNAQTEYQQKLQQLLALTVPELKQFDNVDWERLGAENPAEVVRLQTVYSGVIRRWNAIQAEIQQGQVQQTQQQEQQKRVQLAQQYPEIVKRVPEFADVQSAKAQGLISDINTTMSRYGFTSEEVAGTITDARILHVAARLAQLEKAEQARKSALGKKTAAPAPNLITPNAAPVHESSSKTKMQKQYERLVRSGTEGDAAKLIEMSL